MPVVTIDKSLEGAEGVKVCNAIREGGEDETEDQCERRKKFDSAH